jgi:hypothetical protein
VFGGTGSSLTTIILKGSALRGFNSFWRAIPSMVKDLPHLTILELNDVSLGTFLPRLYSCFDSFDSTAGCDYTEATAALHSLHTTVELM